jgi:hypothetical protein
MRVWDIIDQLDGGIQITEKPRARAPLSGFLASAARVALTVGFAVATSGSFYAGPASTFSSSSGVDFRFPIARSSVRHAPPPARRPRSEKMTDTQFGQSTSKLSRAFAGFFQPSGEEEQLDEEYSF